MKCISSRCGLASLVIAAGLTTSSPALGQADAARQPSLSESDRAMDKPVGDPYPLATCPVSGGKLGTMGEPVVKLYEGREVRFCCGSCPPKFEKDLAKSFDKLDSAIVKDQAPLYPLPSSVVSGKKLPEKPIDWVYNNRLVRLADETEKAEFLKDPKKYMASLDRAAIEQQGTDYPLTTCPVSKDKLGDMGEIKDLVIAGRLIRLCCAGCVKDVLKEPAKYIAVIDAARKAKSGDTDTAPKTPLEGGK